MDFIIENAIRIASNEGTVFDYFTKLGKETNDHVRRYVKASGSNSAFGVVTRLSIMVGDVTTQQVTVVVCCRDTAAEFKQTINHELTGPLLAIDPLIMASRLKLRRMILDAEDESESISVMNELKNSIRAYVGPDVSVKATFNKNTKDPIEIELYINNSATLVSKGKGWTSQKALHSLGS